ncbi:MAG: hypothetical protein ABEJ57_06640 [Halobacteriaceae archaeon]
MAWPHPITTLGFVAGLVAAYGVALAMSIMDEPTLLGAYVLPGETDPLGPGEDDQFLPAVVIQLGVGAVVGGLYPWLFHGILGLEGRWISELPWTIVTGVVLGAVLGLLAIGATLVGWYDYRREDTGLLGGYLVLYGVLLGLLVGVVRPFWYDIFLV